VKSNFLLVRKLLILLALVASAIAPSADAASVRAYGWVQRCATATMGGDAHAGYAWFCMWGESVNSEAWAGDAPDPTPQVQNKPPVWGPPRASMYFCEEDGCYLLPLTVDELSFESPLSRATFSGHDRFWSASFDITAVGAPMSDGGFGLKRLAEGTITITTYKDGTRTGLASGEATWLTEAPFYAGFVCPTTRILYPVPVDPLIPWWSPVRAPYAIDTICVGTGI
jgi:hypothetical protein